MTQNLEDFYGQHCSMGNDGAPYIKFYWQSIAQAVNFDFDPDTYSQWTSSQIFASHLLWVFKKLTEANAIEDAQAGVAVDGEITKSEIQREIPSAGENLSVDQISYSLNFLIFRDDPTAKPDPDFIL